MGFRGRTAEVHLRVSSLDSAEATRLSPKDGFPAVAATSRIVDLMESAATRLMRTEMRSGETSVPVELRMNYLAAIRLDPQWRAVAHYQGIAGRLHRFEVNVFGESGLIASCTLTRAVLSPGPLLGGAPRRAARHAP